MPHWSTADDNQQLFWSAALVAAMAQASGGKRRQVAALHIAVVICPSFARIPHQKTESHLHPADTLSMDLTSSPADECDSHSHRNGEKCQSAK